MDTLIPLREQRDNDLVRLLLKHKYYLVELVRLYSNPAGRDVLLSRVRRDALSVRPTESLDQQRRQHQRRLSMAVVTELIKAYERQETVKELAKRFGIHRATVTALLRRHGVVLRRPGLASDDIPAAASLYRQGWSCARLGERFGVDAATAWRALCSAGIAMRSVRR
jgi:hypothetical protein